MTKMTRSVGDEGYGPYVMADHEAYRPPHAVARHFPKLFASLKDKLQALDDSGDHHSSRVVVGSRVSVQPISASPFALVDGEHWIATRADPHGDLSRPSQSFADLLTEIEQRLTGGVGISSSP